MGGARGAKWGTEPYMGSKKCVDVALRDMVSDGFGSAEEWLDSMVFEGFSNPNHSMVLLGQARSSVHHVKQRNRGTPAILTHTNTHIPTGIYI